MGAAEKTSGAWILTLTYTCCVTLSKALNLSGLCFPSTLQSFSKCPRHICLGPGTEDTGTRSSACATHSPGMTSREPLAHETECHSSSGTFPTWHPPLSPLPPLGLAHSSGALPPVCPPAGGSSRAEAAGDFPQVLAPGTRLAGDANRWPEARWLEVATAQS